MNIIKNKNTRRHNDDVIRWDLLINYIIYEGEGELTTYNGYQVVRGMDSVRTEDNVARVTVKPGTLLVTITGGNNEGVVWQGYASGILSQSMIKDPAKIKSAVQQIFNEFDYKAFTN